MQHIVVLGTGGTIAGETLPGEAGYRAAQRSIEQLLDAAPGLTGLPIECEQVAQIDSKDMDAATWQRLAQRVAHHLARAEVQGVVVTHGTDTLEETALFLQRVLAPAKPVVLTGAMRPASDPEADGPGNLADAVSVVQSPVARGVCVVMAGQVFGPDAVRKAHAQRDIAFDTAGGVGLATLWLGTLRVHGTWARGTPTGTAALQRDPATWPRVEIVLNHAGADGRLVDALLAQGVAGLVVAGTGNGTVSGALLQALQRAQAAGVQVVRSSRCASGAVSGEVVDGLPAAPEATPQQARVGLLLALLGDA